MKAMFEFTLQCLGMLFSVLHQKKSAEKNVYENENIYSERHALKHLRRIVHGHRFGNCGQFGLIQREKKIGNNHINTYLCSVSCMNHESRRIRK